MMKIYSINISNPPAMYMLKKTRLASEITDRVNRYLREVDRTRTLIGYYMMKSITANHLSCSLDEVNVSYSYYGKPYLKGHPLHFNLSHAGDWVVMVVSDVEVGIDIEKINSIDLDVASLFFSKEEIRDLNSKGTPEKEAYFFDLWTLKEAYLKLDGKGLHIPLDSFYVRKDHNGVIKSSLEEVYFRQFAFQEGYKLSVASKREEFAKKIELLA